MATIDPIGIAESLANSLQVVLGTAERLLMDFERGLNLDPERLRILRKRALEASVAAGGLISSANEGRSRPAKVLLPDVLRRALDACTGILQDARIGVRTKFDESAAVFGDPSVLEETMNMLVASSADRLRACGPCELRLSVAAEDGWIAVTAEDDISAERIHASATRRSNPAGMALCQDILVAYGGRLAMKTSPSGGSRITLMLPAAGTGAARATADPERMRAAA